MVKSKSRRPSDGSPLSIIAALLSFASCNVPAHGSIFSANGVDPRMVLNRSAPENTPYLPIAWAVTEGPILGLSGIFAVQGSNAIIVSPCYAIVSYHGVFGIDKEPFAEGKNYVMTAYIGVGELSNGFAYALRMRPVRARSTYNQNGNSHVLMQMERCAGAKIGWLTYESLPVGSLIGKSVRQVGYSGDLPTGVLTAQRCTIRGDDKIAELLKHDCATRAGSTEAPLFACINGNMKVIATAWGTRAELPGVMRRYDDDHANLADPIDDFVNQSDLQRIIEDDRLRYSKAAPLKVVCDD